MKQPYSTLDSDTITCLPFKTKSQSRIPQVFLTPPAMAPKTLKNVTQYLGKNGEIMQTHYSFSDSDSHSDGFLNDFKSSYSPISYNLHVETTSSMKVDTTEHHHLYKDTHHRAPHRQRYELALMSKSGQVRFCHDLIVYLSFLCFSPIFPFISTIFPIALPMLFPFLSMCLSFIPY